MTGHAQDRNARLARDCRGWAHFWRLTGKPSGAGGGSVAVRRGQEVANAPPGQDVARRTRVIPETVAKSPDGVVHERRLVLVLGAPHAAQQFLVDQHATSV